jgi:hypothetical protein
MNCLIQENVANRPNFMGNVKRALTYTVTQSSQCPRNRAWSKIKSSSLPFSQLGSRGINVQQRYKALAKIQTVTKSYHVLQKEIWTKKTVFHIHPQNQHAVNCNLQAQTKYFDTLFFNIFQSYY